MTCCTGRFTLKVGVLEPYTDLTAQLQGAEQLPVTARTRFWLRSRTSSSAALAP